MGGASLRADFGQDLQRVSGSSDGRLGCLIAIAVNPGLQSLLLYRLQHSLQRRSRMRIAGLVRTVNSIVTGADFVVGCDIGPGLFLPHPVGLVVGHGVKVGRNCSLMQGVTLGEVRVGKGSDGAYPVLLDSVTVGAGSRVLGGITVGARASIGANSVVLNDVPEAGVAVGVPARILNKQGE